MGIAAQNGAVGALPIHLIDMNDQVCATAPCGVVRNGVVVFTDDNHLTANFSRLVAPVLGQRLAPFVIGGATRSNVPQRRAVTR